MIQLPPPQSASIMSKNRADMLVSRGRSLFFSLVFLFLFVLAFPSLLVGLFLYHIAERSYDPKEFWRGLWATSIGSVVCYLVWVWVASPFPFILSSFQFTFMSFLRPLFLLWMFNLWLAPLCSVVISGLSGLARARVRVAQPKQSTVLEIQESEVALQMQEQEALTLFKRMSSNEVSERETQEKENCVSLGGISSSQASELEVLGQYEGGELGEWVVAGNVCIRPTLFEGHGVIVGEPRQGKTYTLLKLAAIAKAYGRKVYYLDLKGSRKTAALFLAAMGQAGVQRIKMYPGEAYDGWRGEPQALFNRLMEQIDPSSHPFYREGVSAMAVSLAVHAPGGLPRNSQQFLERLDHEWLEQVYAHDAQALRDIKDIAPHLGGVALVFGGFFRGVAGGLDGTWAYEDTDACYIGIDGTANKQEAAALGRFLLEDAAHYATERKSADEQALLIVDEFGVMRSTGATDLYERVREAGLSIFVSGQSYQSLGRERDHLLASAGVKILHRSGNPEPIVRYAGQRERFTFSRGTGLNAGDDEEVLLPMGNRAAGDPGIHTVARPAKEFAVPIEDVQQLDMGHVVLITAGRAAYIRVIPLSFLPQMLQAAVSFVSQMRKFQPLPPPVQSVPSTLKSPSGQSNQPSQQGQSVQRKLSKKQGGQKKPLKKQVASIAPNNQPNPDADADLNFFH